MESYIGSDKTFLERVPGRAFELKNFDLVLLPRKDVPEISDQKFQGSEYLLLPETPAGNVIAEPNGENSLAEASSVIFGGPLLKTDVPNELLGVVHSGIRSAIVSIDKKLIRLKGSRTLRTGPVCVLLII